MDLTKEEKLQILLDYLQLTGKKLHVFAKETGYEKSTMSLFHTGSKEIPKWFAWGLWQATLYIRLQQLMAK